VLFLERTCWLADHAEVFRGRSPVRADKHKDKRSLTNGKSISIISKVVLVSADPKLRRLGYGAGSSK